MNKKQEDVVRERVRAFVEGLEGYYEDHVSDKCLVGMIVQAMHKPMLTNKSISMGSEYLDGEKLLKNGDIGVPMARSYGHVCYDAVQPIFETLLETECGEHSNGHHRAQAFERFMVKYYGIDPKEY